MTEMCGVLKYVCSEEIFQSVPNTLRLTLEIQQEIYPIFELQSKALLLKVSSSTHGD